MIAVDERFGKTGSDALRHVVASRLLVIVGRALLRGGATANNNTGHLFAAANGVHPMRQIGVRTLDATQSALLARRRASEETTERVDVGGRDSGVLAIVVVSGSGSL